MTDSIYTYQDMEEAISKNQKESFISQAIDRHKSTSLYKTAIIADLYDAQKNKTINEYVKTIFNHLGQEVVNFTASNMKIASNFFHRLNTQRCMYSLGRGISFIDVSESGKDTTKERLGSNFDHDIQQAAYLSLIHGVTFCFWNIDRLYSFPVTEFVPIWDEFDGTLKAGIRFWQLTPDYPLNVVLYEIDGITKYTEDTKNGKPLQVTVDKHAYKQKVAKAPADAEGDVIGVENYSTLPIVPMWGSKLHESTLIGMRQAIDSYDLIQSGFANDLSDVAQIYWIIENAGGMSEKDLARFRDKLLTQHIAQADTSKGSQIKPYSQEIPYQARMEYLKNIRSSIYEAFGGLDVHAVAAGATNDHIDAAYQPMDEEAADFEYQISEAIKQILALIGIDDTPVYHRTRISNQMEQVDMVVAESIWLDRETILRKLPNIEADEVSAIIDRAEAEEAMRVVIDESETEDGTEEEKVEEEPVDENQADQMLNGAQATAVVSITQNVQKGTISKDQAVYLIQKVLAVPEEEARSFVESGEDAVPVEEDAEQTEAEIKETESEVEETEEDVEEDEDERRKRRNNRNGRRS